MTRHAPILIVAIPLAAALAAPVLALLSDRLVRWVAVLALAFSFGFALNALVSAAGGDALSYRLGGWAPPWGIEYRIDALGGLMAVLVSAMALAAAVYGGGFAGGGRGLEAGTSLSLFLLLSAGLLGMVVTGDVFNLYVFLEISSLAAYALIASGGDRASVASYRYLLAGTAGASFYLLGIGYLYAQTGTLNMQDLAATLPVLARPWPLATAIALVAAGMALKIGLFPLHGWLPDAYAAAPAPAAGLIAAVMGKVALYVLLRLFGFVLDGLPAAQEALALLGLLAIPAVLAGSALAASQDDVRRMLAYSSVAQIGYLLLGLGLGNELALTGALLHLVNHAVMKGGLFLAAGAALQCAGARTVGDFAGLGRRMPWTSVALTVSAVSMIGLPPAAGFFGKWYLVLGALERGGAFGAATVAAVVVSSLLTAVYFFRLIERIWLARTDGDTVRSEAPAAMLVPVLALAAGVTALGLFNQSLVAAVIRFAIPTGGGS